MRKIVSILLILSAGLGLKAQDATTNLQKYWVYRERLKNFVVVGDCPGCSMPAVYRLGNGSSEPNTAHFDDNNQRMAMYIGFLATEYRLLANSGGDLSATKKELFYAIQAINRLDYVAESSWGTVTPSAGGQHTTPVLSDLNGFFIRDDVSAGWNVSTYNNKMIRDYISNSKVPLPDNYEPVNVNSGYTTGLNYGVGPREESLDAVIELYWGLALVVKLVNSADYYSIGGNNSTTTGSGTATGFLDGTTTYVAEAQAISKRMTSFISNYNWHIVNPGYANGCVSGVSNPMDRSCLPGALGGGSIFGLTYGFAMADCAIENNFNSVASCVASSLLTSDPIDVKSFNTIYPSQGIPNNQNDKYIKLLAVSNMYGGNTMGVIDTWAKGANEAYHVPLLNNVLWGTSNPMNNGMYECMLNTAPCRGPSGNGNYEWSNPDRVINGPNTNGQAWAQTQIFGVDYLLYFNLYCLENPGYLSSAGGFHAIAPEKLCMQNISETNYNETKERNFLAANTITAGSNYTIAKQNLTFGAYSGTVNGNVTFEAGNLVQLLPGFTVQTGAKFQALTNSTLATANCTTVDPPNKECSNCEITGTETDPSPSYVGPYKVYDFGTGVIYVSTPHCMFKFSDDGGTGDNMFNITPGANGGGHLIGWECFSQPITDVNYFQGSLYVSFNDGNMNRYPNGGGTGNTFLSPYRTGNEAFGWGAVSASYVDAQSGYFFIGLANGEVLLVSSAGTGANMFAINQGSTSFSGIPGYGYFLGEHYYGSRVNTLTRIGTYVMVGLANGNLYKNTVGTGQSMFAGGHNVGSQQFNEGVVFVQALGANLIVGLADHKSLVVTGLGGTGMNMFAVVENSTSFSACCNPTPYYVGDQKFSGSLTAVYNDLNDYANGNSILCFDDGSVVKTVGGSGNNFTFYHQGGTCQFADGVTDFKKIGTDFILSLSNGKMLKLNSLGTTGMNMWGLVNTPSSMHNLCGYYNLIGCENFPAEGGKSMTQPTINQPTVYNTIQEGVTGKIQIIPNPNNGSFSLNVPPDGTVPDYTLTVQSTEGALVYSEKGTLNGGRIELTMPALKNGIYIVHLSGSNSNYFEKLVISH